MTLLGAVLVGSGAYLFIYLYRWEWNRAHTAGVFLIVAEIALVAMVLDARISRLESRVSNQRKDGTNERHESRNRRSPEIVRMHIRDVPPRSRSHFAWLRPDSSSTNVFVPALMGAGIVMSGLAWLIERLGRATAKPALENDLARRLGPLWYDAREGLVPAPATASRVDGVPDVLLAPRPR
jgi:hypothetical protein